MAATDLFLWPLPADAGRFEGGTNARSAIATGHAGHDYGRPSLHWDGVCAPQGGGDQAPSAHHSPVSAIRPEVTSEWLGGCHGRGTALALGAPDAQSPAVCTRGCVPSGRRRVETRRAIDTCGCGRAPRPRRPRRRPGRCREHAAGLESVLSFPWRRRCEPRTQKSRMGRPSAPGASRALLGRSTERETSTLSPLPRRGTNLKVIHNARRSRARRRRLARGEGQTYRA